MQSLKNRQDNMYKKSIGGVMFNSMPDAFKENMNKIYGEGYNQDIVSYFGECFENLVGRKEFFDSSRKNRDFDALSLVGDIFSLTESCVKNGFLMGESVGAEEDVMDKIMNGKGKALTTIKNQLVSALKKENVEAEKVKEAKKKSILTVNEAATEDGDESGSDDGVYGESIFSKKSKVTKPLTRSEMNEITKDVKNNILNKKIFNSIDLTTLDGWKSIPGIPKRIVVGLIDANNEIKAMIEFKKSPEYSKMSKKELNNFNAKWIGNVFSLLYGVFDIMAVISSIVGFAIYGSFFSVAFAPAFGFILGRTISQIGAPTIVSIVNKVHKAYKKKNKVSKVTEEAFDKFELDLVKEAKKTSQNSSKLYKETFDVSEDENSFIDEQHKAYEEAASMGSLNPHQTMFGEEDGLEEEFKNIIPTQSNRVMDISRELVMNTKDIREGEDTTEVSKEVEKEAVTLSYALLMCTRLNQYFKLMTNEEMFNRLEKITITA